MEGEYGTAYRPEQALSRVPKGEVDAVLQVAILTPWWTEVIDGAGYVPLPAESSAIEKLVQNLQLEPRGLPTGYWKSLNSALPALDFSDFLVLVRDDLPDDIAYLLTWILVPTREVIERQYKHVPVRSSPISYPLDPTRIAQTAVPLHLSA